MPEEPNEKEYAPFNEANCPCGSPGITSTEFTRRCLGRHSEFHESKWWWKHSAGGHGHQHNHNNYEYTGASRQPAFRSEWNLLYTINSTSPTAIGIFDGTTNTTVNVGNDARDMTLAPDGKSVYVGDFSGGKIFQVDLTTHAVTQFASGLGPVDGIAFGSDGNLYAVANNRTQIDELDSTGAVIHSLAGFGQLDGMTFDSSTNSIWVGANNATLYQFALGLGSSTAFTTANLGIIDGIASDGNGNLFVANFGSNIAKYNIGSNTAAIVATTPGIDDLAPVAGLGAPNVPEPGSIILLGTVLVFAAGGFRRRFAKSSNAL